MGKHRRHTPRKSVGERIWAVLIILGFLALALSIVYYYAGPEILSWFSGLLDHGQSPRPDAPSPQGPAS